MQKMSDPPLSTCPECGKETFSKQLSAPGFQLKGSGWYATDFKKSETKTEPKAESKKEEAA
jgi:predicted nucleic acid-binding Zn ribbon protein